MNLVLTLSTCNISLRLDLLSYKVTTLLLQLKELVVLLQVKKLQVVLLQIKELVFPTMEELEMVVLLREQMIQPLEEAILLDGLLEYLVLLELVVAFTGT